MYIQYIIYIQYTFYTFASTVFFSEFVDEPEFSALSARLSALFLQKASRTGLAISGDKSPVILGESP